MASESDLGTAIPLKKLESPLNVLSGQVGPQEVAHYAVSSNRSTLRK